jgi:cytochrome c oxidase subunit 3
VTWAHHGIIAGDRNALTKGLALTVFLGVIFTGFQVYEYDHATFAFTDGIYASTFYLATGFHGFHVFVGTMFLLVCYFRARAGHFTPEHHFGLEAAAWYWHFVDVVWIFLFASIYIWGA